MDNVTLLLGPYVGDWEHEITTFRPYIRWIMEVFNHEDVFLSTHSNRTFLYDWIPKENIFPIFGEFSRNEIFQTGYVFNGLNGRDYNLLIRRFKDRIQNKKKKIEIVFLNYTKNNNSANYPIYNKIFEKIKVPDDIKISDKHKNKIVFIPDRRENIIRSECIYKLLQKEYGEEVIVVGDMKIHFSEDNIALKNPDYAENGYKYILSYINNAKAVVCPTCHWSIISNVQGVPLFTWGKNASQFKEEGIYNFENKCLSFSTDKHTKPEIIIKMLEHFRRVYAII